MIHILTINNNPSNPQQPIHSLRLAPVSLDPPKFLKFWVRGSHSESRAPKIWKVRCGQTTYLPPRSGVGKL